MYHLWLLNGKGDAMNKFNTTDFDGEKFIKLLDDLYKETHTKDFLILCRSEEIKKELENLDISYKYDIIIEPSISVNLGENILPCNEETFYVIPKNQPNKGLGVYLDTPLTAFLEKIPVEVNWI